MASFEYKRVIFPTSAILDDKEKDLLIFSGAGDIYTTVKKISLNSILKSLHKIREKKEKK